MKLLQLHTTRRVTWAIALATVSVIASPAESAGVRPIAVPGVEGSGMPYLAPTRDGGLILSWLEPATNDGKSQRLRIARWRDGSWQDATTVRTSDNWFINWADFPSVIEMPDGTLFAHWLQRTGGGNYGYGVSVARASQWKGPWHETFFARPSDLADYSGFLSWAVVDGKPRAAYLAPPGASADHAGDEHRKTLRIVSFDAAGSVEKDVELDADTCSCCPTAMVSTSAGMAIAYRDHSSDEVRDISIVWEQNGKWTAPKSLHHDGWKINGCPTDGPSMSAEGDTVGVAWLTRADDKPRVQAAFSANRAPFKAPVRVDDGNPLGRPATVWFRRDLLVVWLEKTAEGTDVRLRRVSPDGSMSPSLRIAWAPPGRGAGFPKIAVTGDGNVLIAWRDGRVRTAVLPARLLR